MLLLNLNADLQDRFAIDRYLPSVDESQDWFLVSGDIFRSTYPILKDFIQ